VYVDDVVKAVRFYENAFGLKVKFVHESNMYAEMETGETTLSFAHDDMLAMHTGMPASKGTKNCFEIAFTTDDVRGAFDKAISCGAKEIKQPEQKPWGQTVAYVGDAFGTIIEICTPMG
jgi:uncharacterized glyoxalase superfamily protein PhnB